LAYCERGLLDGRQPFEERRLLWRKFIPSVVTSCPVLGKGEWLSIPSIRLPAESARHSKRRTRSCSRLFPLRIENLSDS
jgi:hypothetical protein